MTIKLGVVMDPIANIKLHKDSTFAMLLEAQARQWELYYMEQADIFYNEGGPFAKVRRLSVEDNPEQWFEFSESETIPLESLDVILMRKDPPFDMEYIYTTYLLELAEHRGTLVVNKSQALRDTNEKLYASWFPQCCPPTMVSRNHSLLREFVTQHQEIILKPLDGMGGSAVFRANHQDSNLNVIIETLTQLQQRSVMAQKFIPEVVEGDKRILLIDGKPVSHALARIPAAGEHRANLASGGTGVAQPLSERDHWICEQVGETLRNKGLLLVGLDVIGDYLTEINVTSPTCFRELDEQCGLNVSKDLFDCIERRLS